jgi:hypothetical protein
MAVRLSPLNLALLFITACAVIFGAWGMYEAAESSTPQPRAPVIDDDEIAARDSGDSTSSRITRRSDCDSRTRGDERPASSGSGNRTPKPADEALFDLPDLTVSGQPSDKGDARMCIIVVPTVTC